VIFEYSNSAGTGAFLVSQVSGWHNMLPTEWYDIHLKGTGILHSLTEAELARLKPLWEQAMEGL
jgi:hypothetical protein